MFILLEQISDYICAVKLHIDIFQNLNLNEFVQRINKLKTDKKFLVIEDKKFSDIPPIAQLQLVNVLSYADIVTVHGICGEKLIEQSQYQHMIKHLLIAAGGISLNFLSSITKFLICF